MTRVVAKPNPFRNDLVYCDMEEGVSLERIVGIKESSHILALVDGVPVPREAWAATFPRRGEIVSLAVIPQTFGILESLAAVMSSLATMTGATAAGAAAVNAAFSIGMGASAAAMIGNIVTAGVLIGQVASFAMGIASAVVRPQMPSYTSSGNGNGRFYSLTQANNQNAQWSYIPKLYGRFRITPPMAANVYTHVKDGEQYLHVLLCLGHGPLRIGSFDIGHSHGIPFIDSRESTVRTDFYTIGAVGYGAILVGDAPIHTYPEADWQIGTVSAVMNPPNGRVIYSQEIEEDNVSLELKCAAEMGWSEEDDHWEDDGTFVTHTTSQGAIGVWFDITFNALYTIAGETSTSDYKGRVAIVVSYINSAVLNNGGQYRTATLDKQTQLTKGQETIDAWDINSLYKSPRRFTNGFDIWTGPDGLDRWGRNPATSTYTVKITRKWSYRVKHTVSSFTDAMVSGFRSFKNSQAWRPSPHVHTDDVILMALKIRATGQLSGSLPPVSILATSVLPITTPAGPSTTWLPTSNPADIYPDIVRGTHLAPGSRLSADKLNWSKLQEWRDYCAPGPDQRTFEYNWYQTDSQPVIDRLRAVAATGRASWAIVDSLLTVVLDNSFVPVQMISPRNSTGFEFSKTYPNVPHALRVQWVNPESWQTDELLVLDDGYYQLRDGVYYDPFGQVVGAPAADGLIYNPPPPNNPTIPLKPPTLYEVLETEGVSNRAQAFIEGRYYLAAMRMRRETYKATLSIENLVATRGDCVYMAHDALLIGRAYGRIIDKVEVVYNSQAYIQLTLDEEVSFTQDRLFCLRIRSVDEGVTSHVVAPIIKLHNPNVLTPVKQVVCFNDANEPGSMAKLSHVVVGDLFVFGPVGTETLEAKITNIDYSSDLSATITAVPAAPGILESDRNPIREDFPGSIPDPPPEYRAPPVPKFEAFFANVNDVVITPDGVKCKVVATWSIPMLGNTSRPEFVYIYYSIDGHVTWRVAYTEASLGVISLSDIPVKTTISAYLRSHNSANGKFSDPSETKTITTPDVNPWIPLAPAGLFLEPISYPNPDDNGSPILYVLRCAWKIHGYSSNVEIAHTQDPNQDDIDLWSREMLGAGVVSADIPIAEETIPVDGFITVRVWVRNAVFWEGQTIWSAWSKGEVDVYRRDLEPPPLTAFSGIPFVDQGQRGVKLSWTYPELNGSTHPDIDGIEIWESRYNARDGGMVDGTPVPPATRLVQLELGNPEVTEYFYPIEDQAYHYYWARTKDGTGNRSGWLPISSNDGVKVFAGIKGDGAPPPPPIAVAEPTLPDNWQIMIRWGQPAQLPDDVLGTRIWRMEHVGYEGIDPPPAPTFDEGTTISLGFIKELQYTDTFLTEDTWYSYWLANIDFEGFESDKIGPFTDMALGDFSKYIRIIKAEQITADKINTRGITVREATDPYAVIFGAGQVIRPDWLAGMYNANDMDAYIRKGAIRWAYVGGDEDFPGFIRSFQYTPTYEENGDVVPGTGWSINHDGSAEFRNIKARGTLLSDNFSQGHAGWRVSKSGNAEFNEGVFRGQLAADCLILGTDYPLMKIGEFAMGRAINILPSGRFFSFDTLGNSLNNSRLTFVVENVPEANVGWTAVAYPGAVAIPLSGSGEQRYLDATYMWNGGSPYQKIVVRAQVQADFDEVVIVGLLSDTALRMVLSQNRFNLATDSNGSVLSFSAAFGYAKVYMGVVDVTDMCSFSISNSGCSVSIVSDSEDPNHGKYIASGIAVQDASASIAATYQSTTLYEAFYLSKQKSGWIGGNGVFGTRAFVSDNDAYYDAYFDNAAVADSIVVSTAGSGGVVYEKDVLTLRNSLTGYAKTRSREWNGSAFVWVPLAAFVDGNMIVRNAITANHITANSIKTEHLQANSINANHIQANSIVANHILANSITADRIKSGDIARLFYVSNTESATFDSDWHLFTIGTVYIPQQFWGSTCCVSVHVSSEASVNADQFYLRVTGSIDSGDPGWELYNKPGNGGIAARFFSGLFGWEMYVPNNGVLNLYLKVHHNSNGGLSSDPRAVVTIQRS